MVSTLQMGETEAQRKPYTELWGPSGVDLGQGEV